MDTILFANSSAIAACLPASVPAYQRTSSFHKYTRARTCIYFRKLLVRWYAGTLLTFYSLSTHSPMSTQNSTNYNKKLSKKVFFMQKQVCNPCYIFDFLLRVRKRCV